MNTRLCVLSLILSAFVYPVAAFAQWQLDGTALCTAANEQDSPLVVSDGAGGAIVIWTDHRTGTTGHVYAQRVNASGIPQWTADGVALCTAAGGQVNPTIIADGAGGAIVTWYDNRNGLADIYAQRVNASGVVQWTPDGVAVCTAPIYQLYPEIISDGAGGAIVAWQDGRGADYDIYAQRVNASGVVQWTTDGVALCTAANNQFYPTIASDGSGGAIVTWQDYRSATSYDVYARRVNATGVVQWTSDGVALCTAAYDQIGPTAVADGSGGAIVAWTDFRNGTDYDVYAQRVDGSGVVQWTSDGVAVSTGAGNQQAGPIVSDGAGGAIVPMQDSRNGSGNDIYAQRVNASGVDMWTADGVALCTAANNQYYPTAAADGSGGAIVTWADQRSATNVGHIYAQRVNAAGAVQWMADGAALSTAGPDSGPYVALDGAGGAIVTWTDYRGDPNHSHIYAQRVEETYGYWGHPEPIVTSVADVPNDQGGHVAVNWDASGRDLPVPATIDFYSVWRAVDMSAVAGRSRVLTSLTSPDDVTLQTPPGALTQVANSSYYWELVATQSAYRLPTYSFSASTRADSVAGNAGTEAFMVMAHDQTDNHIAFPSNTMTGHSVDNLAPAAPLYLTAQRNGNDVDLSWNGVHVSDLKDYAVYRSEASGVAPIQTDFLANDTDTVLVDSGAPTSSLYYIVTAYDVHQNQSKPSNEAIVSATTNVGNTPSITALTVLQNRPNPFGAQTELEIGLPAASEIEVDVYDVAGHRVREKDVAGVKGWQAIPFAGLDDRGEPLASGMYFYKISAHGETVTRKMLITR